MTQIIEQCIRYILAFLIYPGKEKTIKNVLKYALKLYLTHRSYKGLCICVTTALIHYNYTVDIEFISDIIPQFNQNTAIKYFNGVEHLYWWDINDWFSRYRFMKWLIRQY